MWGAILAATAAAVGGIAAGQAAKRAAEAVRPYPGESPFNVKFKPIPIDLPDPALMYEAPWWPWGVLELWVWLWVIA